MKLKNQVCNLELAKKLKELGVKQESLWWYRVDEFGNSFLRLSPELDSWEHLLKINSKKGVYKHYSAFTVAELMKIYYELRFGNYPRFEGLGMRPENLVDFIAKEFINEFQFKKRKD